MSLNMFENSHALRESWSMSVKRTAWSSKTPSTKYLTWHIERHDTSDLTHLSICAVPRLGPLQSCHLASWNGKTWLDTVRDPCKDSSSTRKSGPRPAMISAHTAPKYTIAVVNIKLQTLASDNFHDIVSIVSLFHIPVGVLRFLALGILGSMLCSSACTK